MESVDKASCNYLLTVDDMAMCEAEFLRVMGFSCYDEAKAVMSKVKRT